MGVMETIAGQNLSQGNVDTVMKVLQMQAENARASMNAGVAMRGQDIDQSTAMAQMQTTARGQDLQQQSWSEKNAIDREQMQNSAEYQKGMLESQAKGIEIQKGQLELQQKQAALKEANNLLVSDAFQKGGWDGMKQALASAGEFKMALDIEEAQQRINQNNVTNERNARNDMIDNAGKMIDSSTKDYALRKQQVGDFVGAELASVVNMEDGPEKQQAVAAIASKGNQLMGYEIFNPNDPNKAILGMQILATKTSEDLQKNPMLARSIYGDEKFNQMKQDLNKVQGQGGLNISMDEEGKVSEISMGGGSKQAANKSIERYDAAIEFGDNMKLVKEAFNPDSLGWAAKAKNWYLDIRDKSGAELTPEQKDFVDKREGLITNVEQMFNAYRKAITGAAASEKELENLRNTFLNADLGSYRFQSRMNTMFNKWETDIARETKGMQQGGVSSSGFDSRADGSGGVDYSAAGEAAMSKQSYGDAADFYEKAASMAKDDNEREMLLLKAQQANKAAQGK